ncbi:MAG: hypothetical protein MUD12_13180 [Spirochaetes bacterium]|jgi:hypothetical protein|nr:hypothetical protein [Spirochaetota bacterium]
MNRFVTVFQVLIMAMLIACASDGNAGPEAGLPSCETTADVKANHGKRVVVRGVYLQDALPGGKRLQAATILLGDGSSLIRSYRPVPAEFRFINRKVVASGKVFTDAGLSRDCQQVMAPHFYPDEIRLAPGESPYEGKPGVMPPLPFVTDRKSAGANAGKWVHVFGVLESLEKLNEGPVGGRAVVLLADGTKVAAGRVNYNSCAGLTGKSVTMTAVIYENDGRNGFEISFPNAVCGGKKPYCGMSGGKDR